MFQEAFFASGCTKEWQHEKYRIAYESEFLRDLMWWEVSAGADDIRDVGVIQA